MGNSPSASAASAPPPQGNAPAAPAPSTAPQGNTSQANMTASLSVNSKKNNAKTVVQVPAENVTVVKGGKRRRLRGGVASVQFDLIPRAQPSDAVMDRVTSAPSGFRGGRRTRRRSRRSRRSRPSRRRQ